MVTKMKIKIKEDSILITLGQRKSGNKQKDEKTGAEKILIDEFNKSNQSS